MAAPRNTKSILRAVWFGILGCALLPFGLFKAVETIRSARLTAQGEIRNLRQTHGRGAFSHFSLFNQQGYVSDQMTTDYNGSNLVEGESVEVKYVGFNGTVTHLRVLDGPYTGWSLQEGDGTVTSLFVACLGGLFLFVTYAELRRRLHVASLRRMTSKSATSRDHY
jgi:hypothetical protein